MGIDPLLMANPPVNLEQLVQEVLAESELARAAAIQRRWQAYTGDWLLKAMGDPSRSEREVVVAANKARVIVDKGVSFLMGKSVRFEIDADLDTVTESEAWLEAAWQANQKDLLLHQLALSGAIAGHAFLRVIPEHPSTAPFPRLVLLDPATVSPQYSDDDLLDVYGWVVQWNAADRAGKPLVRRQRFVRADSGEWWDIVQERCYLGQQVWVEEGRERWSYPVSPIAHCQNLPRPHEFWGESDLPDDLLALILARNANLSDWRRVQRFHGFPKIWGRGFGGTVQAIELGVDKVVVLPGQDAELNVLQAPGDSQGAMALDRVLDDAIHEIARIPQVATGKLESAGNLSGLALEILYGPLIEKTRTKQLLYGQLLAHASRCLLLAGRGQDVPVRVVWPETLPRDDQGAAQTALIWQQLGVSRQTILRRLGFDPAQEAQARAEDEHDLGQEAARAFNAGIGLEP